MSDELKPCPFCGGEASFGEGKKGDGSAWHYIECEECSAAGPYINDADHNIVVKECLAAAWNTRADLPATDAQAMANPKVQALVEALERIAHASDVYGIEANAEDQGADTLAYAHKSTCNLARAALAAF